MKSYALIFVGIIAIADALAPISGVPMWRSAVDSISATMQVYQKSQEYDVSDEEAQPPQIINTRNPMMLLVGGRKVPGGTTVRDTFNEFNREMGKGILPGSNIRLDD